MCNSPKLTLEMFLMGMQTEVNIKSAKPIEVSATHQITSLHKLLVKFIQSFNQLHKYNIELDSLIR